MQLQDASAPSAPVQSPGGHVPSASSGAMPLLNTSPQETSVDVQDTPSRGTNTASEPCEIPSQPGQMAAGGHCQESENRAETAAGAMVSHESVPLQAEGEDSRNEAKPCQHERPLQPDGIRAKPAGVESQAEGASAPPQQRDPLPAQQIPARDPLPAQQLVESMSLTRAQLARSTRHPLDAL